MKAEDFHKKKTEFLDKYPSVTIAGMHDLTVINIVDEYADGNCDEIQCINKIITCIDNNSKTAADMLIVKTLENQKS